MDYGARWYHPGVGRFLGVDPLAADYASWSPYNYVLGNPISLVDPDGRAPEDYPIYDKDGTLIGYVVEPGQGPTQIAQDLNTNYGCELSCDITYTDIVQDNTDAFPNGFTESGDVKDKGDDSFKSGNIEPGQILKIDGGINQSEVKGNEATINAEGKTKDSLLFAKSENERMIELIKASRPSSRDPVTGHAVQRTLRSWSREIDSDRMDERIKKIDKKIDSLENANDKLKGEN